MRVNLYDEFEGCEDALDRLYEYAIEHRLGTDLVDTIASEMQVRHREDYVHLERSTFLEGQDYEAELRQFNRRLLERKVLPELKRYHLSMEGVGRPDLDYDVSDIVDELEEQESVEVNFSELSPEELRRLKYMGSD